MGFLLLLHCYCYFHFNYFYYYFYYYNFYCYYSTATLVDTNHPVVVHGSVRCRVVLVVVEVVGLVGVIQPNIHAICNTK